MRKTDPHWYWNTCDGEPFCFAMVDAYNIDIWPRKDRTYDVRIGQDEVDSSPNIKFKTKTLEMAKKKSVHELIKYFNKLIRQTQKLAKRSVYGHSSGYKAVFKSYEEI